FGGLFAATLFIGASILLGLILKLRERVWVDQFITGAQSMLGVALIVGIARGVTVVLNEGKIADSILFYAAGFADSMPPVLFIVLMLVMYMVFTLFISSSSGMAVLTMPIMGGLATLVNVPGREIVNAYLFGMGIMGFITPTGLILPSLALVNVSLKTWLKFIMPFLVMLFVLCAITLIIGLYI
ncbi:MAG: YfcC family protein, partial [Chitinophagaceae bacterium]